MRTGGRAAQDRRRETGTSGAKGRARGSSDEQVAPFHPPMSDADEDEHLFYVLCEQVKAIASRHSNFQPGRSAGSGGGGEVPRGGMHGPMGTSHRRPFPAFFVGGEG